MSGTQPEAAAQDRELMARALLLAARGVDTTHPNPRVGCVIARSGRIVAEGWHERAGGPHAEVMALRAAGGQACGATAYVTLEPCNHQGRTPPCTEALIAAKVARVVMAMGDPNPKVDGTGAARLRAAGIQVDSGVLQEEAAQLNAGFIKRMQHGLPFVRLKLAMSLDGRTALGNGASQWLTGPQAREDVQRWRARSSAVLTGVGTVLADDPRLSVRPAGRQVRQPLRVVLDSRLRTPAAARLFEAAEPGTVWIFTAGAAGGAGAGDARRRALEQRGARVEQLHGAARPDPAAALASLARAEVNEVLAECGATLAGELLRAGLVDELLLYVAPLLLGPQGRALVELPPLSDLGAAPRLRILETRQVGPDLRLRLQPSSPGIAVK